MSIINNNMTIDIQFISDILNNWGAILGGIAAILGGIYKIHRYLKKYRENNHGTKLLTNHFYFKRMRYYLYTYIANLSFKNHKDKRREYSSKTFMYDKVETFYNIMLPLAEEIENTNKLDSIGGIDNILEVVYKGVNTYEDAALKHGVPKVFISKFAVFHKRQVDSVSESINSIINNSIYDSIEEKFSAILDILIGVFTMIMPHISETLDSLNGELTKALNNMNEYDFNRLKIYSKRRLK